MADIPRARKQLRLLMVLLALWDLGIGIYAVGFPKHLQQVVCFAPRAEPLFIRGVGVYWLFAAYMQFLGFRDPTKYLVAVQLAVIFRLSAAVIDSVEILLLPRPFYLFHYLLMFFVLMNCLIAWLTAGLLRRMSLRWIDI